MLRNSFPIVSCCTMISPKRTYQSLVMDNKCSLRFASMSR